jgi:hypothetical protein
MSAVDMLDDSVAFYHGGPLGPSGGLWLLLLLGFLLTTSAVPYGLQALPSLSPAGTPCLCFSAFPPLPEQPLRVDTTQNNSQCTQLSRAAAGAC